MPRRRELPTNCGGCGCGENGCDTCWGESDEEYYRPYKPVTRRRPRSVVSNCEGCGCARKGCASCKGWSGSSDESDDDGDQMDGRDRVSEARRGKRRLEEPSASSSRRDSVWKRRRVEDGDGDNYDEDGGDDYDEDFDGRDDHEEGGFDEEEDGDFQFEDGAAGEPSFKDMVNAMSEQTARDTLVRLASMAPSAQVAIRQAYARQVEKSARQPVNWDFLSKKVWHLLYTSREAELYGAASAERRARLVRRSWDQMDRHLLSMCKQGRPPFANKLSALATARKILKSVLLGAPGSLAGAVRDGLRRPRGGGTDGQALMVAIQWQLVHMTPEEQIRAGGTYDEKGTLLQKYIWCRDEARKLGLESLKELDQVLVKLDMPADN
ncbi:Nuclear cap-binding protein subunit 1 [Pestalotiopsis sp. IQ-011]